jgi:transcriptional repressor NrdR
MLPMLIKKDGRREPWDRGKIVVGLEKACEKLAVSMTDIDALSMPSNRNYRITG